MVDNIGIVITYDDLKDKLADFGLALLTQPNEYRGVTVSNIDVIDQSGYKYRITYDRLLRTGCLRRKIAYKSNPFSIENINHYLNLKTKGGYRCLAGKYNASNVEMEILHKQCGRIFKAKWINLNRNPSEKDPNRRGTRCPFCESTQLESTHALVLKQVFLRLAEGCVVEDKSCINPNTNCRLPTDIVDHNGKRAIEIQSWFHDEEYQAEKDRIKKEFWLSKGYAFYDPDIRDHTILGMVQLFFPEIKEIPDWIDFGYSNKMNDVMAQRLLNSGMKVHEVAKAIHAKPHQIYDAIQYGRLEYPEGYMEACKTAVVQMDMDGKIIAEYSSINEASRYSEVKPGNISSALLHGRSYSGGFYWAYASDYHSSNFRLKRLKYRDHHKPVYQCLTDGEIVRKFDTVFEASKGTKLRAYDILQVAKGKSKSHGGYTWRFVT